MEIWWQTISAQCKALCSRKHDTLVVVCTCTFYGDARNAHLLLFHCKSNGEFRNVLAINGRCESLCGGGTMIVSLVPHSVSFGRGYVSSCSKRHGVSRAILWMQVVIRFCERLLQRNVIRICTIVGYFVTSC
jgi:hypothetical protein